MRTKIIAGFAVLAFVGWDVTHGTAAAIKWGPDRAFAKVLKQGFEAANHGATIEEDVCAKPVLPKNTGLTVGVASDDCLVIATEGGRPFCFEMLYESGNTTGSNLPCALVRRAIQRDAKPGWVVHYVSGLAA